MQRITITELSEPVRSFLNKARAEGIVVEDENGRAQCGVIPYREATPSEKRRAWREIKKVQRVVAKTMRKRGSTEDDLDRLLEDE